MKVKNGKRIDIEIIKDNYYNLLGNNVILKLKASEDIGLGHLSRMITYLKW